jgi:hypothetical protein
LASELAALGVSAQAGHALAWHDSDKPVWALIDCRSRIADQRALQALLCAGDGLVLMAWHEASLTDQAWWLAQCRQFAADKPYVLKGLQPLSSTQVDALLSAPKTAQNPHWPALEVWQFDWPHRVVLAHAMFVLDSARQQLNGALWRVTWLCNTLEYVNPVVIDMTPTRFETRAARPAEVPGHIRVVGVGVHQPALQQQFQEWFAACRAPG